MRGIKHAILFILFLHSLSFAAYGQEVQTTLQFLGAYYFPGHEGFGSDELLIPPDYSVLSRTDTAGEIDPALDPGRKIGNGLGSAEMKAVIEQKRKYPFMDKPGFLTEGNNLTAKYSFELSPVSINALAQLSLTPLAFVQLHAGAAAGTGWTLVFNGLGRNLPGDDLETVKSEPFSGMVYRLWQATTLQFDAAAFFPGDWHHVVISATGRFEYKAFTGAGRNEAWQYEADDGQNFNGFKYLGSYFLGYRMPLMVDTVGMLFETEQWIDHNTTRSMLKDDGWGSDIPELTFGPLVNLSFKDGSSLAVLFQFKNGIDFTDETSGYRYFGYRRSEGIYVKLHRIALRYVRNM